MSNGAESIDACVGSAERPYRRAPRLARPRLFRRRSALLTETARAGDTSSAPACDDPDHFDLAEAHPDREMANGQGDEPRAATQSKRLPRVLILSVLPAMALLLTGAAAYLKYEQSTLAARQTAATESVSVARDIATSMLSYAPENAEATLTKAADRMSGSFRDSFLSLVKDVVAPGAKQRNISAVATIPAVGVTSTTPTNSTLVLFINQEITVAGGPPTNTTSVVEVKLQKSGDLWTLTGFEPK